MTGSLLVVPVMHNYTKYKQWYDLHSQQPLHGLFLSILLSELVQRAVVPAQRSKHHLFGLLLHTAVEERLCKNIQPGKESMFS